MLPLLLEAEKERELGKRLMKSFADSCATAAVKNRTLRFHGYDAERKQHILVPNLGLALVCCGPQSFGTGLRPY